MIITRTPFRISLGGGGSDLPAFYQEHGGAVVSTTIDKYVFVEVHPFFHEHQIQLKYSKTETVRSIAEIGHRIFRFVLRKYNLSGVELSTTADIPAGTGLASSSAFTVGLLKAIHADLGNYRKQVAIAEEACDIEIDQLGDPIGKQDQYACAIGGLNYLQFNPGGDVEVFPIVIHPQKREVLERSLLLVYVGGQRDAASLLHHQQNVVRTSKIATSQVLGLKHIADEIRASLEKGEVDSIGEFLHEGWCIKKQLTSFVSNNEIDEIYRIGRRAGAIGGKLLGAGGGGFILFFCPPDRQPSFIDALSQFKLLGVRFDQTGSQIIYCQ